MLKVLLLGSALFLAACAAPAPQGEMTARYGRVERIEMVTIEGDKKFGVGTVIGAVAGGILGHQIGGGTGKTVATAAGAVAGGVIGNKVENRNQGQAGQHVMVKLDSGGSVGITQPADPNLRVGDRVRVDGGGEDARVVRF